MNSTHYLFIENDSHYIKRYINSKRYNIKIKQAQQQSKTSNESQTYFRRNYN